MDTATEPAGTWFRSLPTVAAVRHLVEQEYPITVSGAVLIRSFNNDVYRVDAGDRSYAFKLYGTGRWTVDEVRWEQQLVRHLTGAGLPVPTVVARRSGDTAGVLTAPEGVRAFSLVEWLPGDKPQPPWTDDLYRDVARTLARFHTAVDGFATRYPRHPVRTGREIAEVVAALRGDPQRRGLVERAGAAAELRLADLAARGLHWGVRHGDPSLDNLHLSAAGLHLYDFDLAAPGWQVEDLIGALLTPFAGVFLSAYTAERPLPPVELEALPWLTILGIIENLHFHLIGKPAVQGTASLTEGWVDDGFRSLAEAAAGVGLA